MLINILKNFDTANASYRTGQNVDVPRELANKWIADGYASADTDGRIDSFDEQVRGAASELLEIEPTAVIFGDSRAAEHSSNDGLELMARGAYNHAIARSGGVIRLIQNAGVSGNTFAQMLARIDNAVPGLGFGGTTSSQPGVTPYPAGWLFGFGAINDISAGTALDVMQARLISIFEKARQAGFQRIVWPTEIATASVTALSSAQIAQLLDWNTWLRGLVNTRGDLFVPDQWQLSVDLESAGGLQRSGVVRDPAGPAVHANNVLGQLLGDQIAQHIALRMGRRVINSFAARASGTSGGAYARRQHQVGVLLPGSTAVNAGTGTMPTNCSVQLGGTTPATAACKVIAAPHGIGQAWQCDLTFPSADAFVALSMPRSESLLSGGEVVAAGVIASVGAAGFADGQVAPFQSASQIKTLRNQFRVTNASAVDTYTKGMSEGSGDGALPLMMDCALIQTQPQPFPVGGTRAQQTIYIMPNAAGASCRVILSIPSIAQ